MIKSYQCAGGRLISAIEKPTISMLAEHAGVIDAQVASGAFASASEVVRAGLLALQERDAAVERWLRKDVAPAYDRWKADSTSRISSEDMAERMRQRHETRSKVGA